MDEENIRSNIDTDTHSLSYGRIPISRSSNELQSWPLVAGVEGIRRIMRAPLPRASRDQTRRQNVIPSVVFMG